MIIQQLQLTITACLFQQLYMQVLWYELQLWEAVGGKGVFKTKGCHDILVAHSQEVKGVTVPNIMGNGVFNAIFAEGKLLQIWLSRCSCYIIQCAVLWHVA